MRLLPRDSTIGWTPYAWLAYLLIFVAHPLLMQPSPRVWVATFVALVLFLPLYFRGYWLRGRKLYPIIVAINLLGLIYAPFNSGATVFFIYAASFIGEVGPPALATRLLAGHMGFVALVCWLGGVEARGWIPGLFFSLMIGGINIHFAGVRRRGAKLRLAQEEVEALATMAERERISRDLHDLLGHTLSMITLKSELAAKLVASEPERAEHEMREVEQTSRQALAEVRRAVQGYRSHNLRGELASARLALETAGVGVVVDSRPHDLPPEVEAVAALALREAVTNVVRHSRAHSCTISYRQERGLFRLSVVDDGKGLRDDGEGSGLAGMRERVEGLGGELEVRSHKGVRLTVTLPLHRSPAGAEVPLAGRAS